MLYTVTPHRTGLHRDLEMQAETSPRGSTRLDPVGRDSGQPHPFPMVTRVASLVPLLLFWE